MLGVPSLYAPFTFHTFSAVLCSVAVNSITDYRLPIFFLYLVYIIRKQYHHRSRANTTTITSHNPYPITLSWDENLGINVWCLPYRMLWVKWTTT